MINQTRRKDGSIHVIAAGTVTKDSDIKETKSGKAKVTFSIAYGKSEYMNCEAWGDNIVGRIAGSLEKGDVVIVAGVVRTWEYNDKEYNSLVCDYIGTMQLPALPPSFNVPDGETSASKAKNAEAPAEFEEYDGEDGDLPF